MALLNASRHFPPHYLRRRMEGNWFHGINMKRSSVPQDKVFRLHMITPQLVGTINKGNDMSEMLALAGVRDLSWAQHVEKTDRMMRVAWRWGR